MHLTYEHGIGLVYFCGVILVAAMYVAKEVVLHYVPNRRDATILFATVIGVLVPLTWAVSPDWGSLGHAPISNYLGTQIAILTVPVVTFVWDVFQIPRRGFSSRWRRFVVEIVAVPLWFVNWIFMELTVLDWIWI